MKISIDRTIVLRFAAFSIGIIYATLWYRRPELLYLAPKFEPISYALNASILFFPVTLILTTFSQRAPWRIYMFIMLGIIAGNMIDVVLDKVDRNLFPIEFIIWFLLTAPGAISGTMIGWFINRRIT